MHAPILLIGTFFASMALFPAARWVGYRYGVMDFPEDRNIHSQPVPRTGGLMLCLALLSAVFVSGLLSTTPIPIGYIGWWQVTGLLLIFLVGFIDDKFTVKYNVRLSLQAIISFFFVATSGMYLTDSGLPILPDLPVIIAIPFTVFCITGVTNAYNIIDGLNGLCAGCGLIFFALTACLAYMYNDQMVVLYALLFAGCLLGFIMFNFPKAKIFLGDGGSYLTGFAVGTIAVIFLIRHPEISTWTMLLMAFVPVFDTVFSIFRRKYMKKSPFKADQSHLHHILRRRYGSNTKAVVVIWAIQILIGTAAIIFHNHTLVLVVVTLLSIIFLWRLWLKQITIAGLKI